jgi:hypothetical protein
VRNAWKIRTAILVLASLTLLFVQPGFAQQRMSDHDIENLMKNLKEDTQRFQSSFNSAISKSTIRKTSQEKEDKALVKSFRNQTETMLNIFQSKRKADTTLPGVLSTAKQIDAVFANVHLGGTAASDWSKCKSELNILANEFNMSAN